MQDKSVMPSSAPRAPGPSLLAHVAHSMTGLGPSVEDAAERRQSINNRDGPKEINLLAPLSFLPVIYKCPQWLKSTRDQRARESPRQSLEVSLLG